MTDSIKFLVRVVCTRLMSSAIALWLALSLPLMAHEVLPTVADLTVENGVMIVDMRLNLEAIVAGIDLDGLEDTDAAENAGDYDELRALEPEALEARLRAFYPQLIENMTFVAGDEAFGPVLGEVAIPEVGDVEVTRASMIRFTAEIPEGARTITMGWDKSFGTLILRQQGVEEPYTGTLTGGELSAAIPLAGGGAQGSLAAFIEYIGVGFEHIVPLGLDHILFVLGLFFLAARLHPVLWQVTTFTLAHTVTLALGALGWVSVPAGIVEPLIAASIVYVAVENVFTDGLNKWRPVVIFCFGLLHGLGFASVLGDFGLPEAQFIPALIGFNVGVEVGQLTVIAVVLLISLAALRASRVAGMEMGVVYGYIAAGLGLGALMIIGLSGALDTYLSPFLLPLMALCFLCATTTAASSIGTQAYRQFVSIPASLVIAAVGIYWVIERVFL